jgi:hypothetical protein
MRSNLNDGDDIEQHHQRAERQRDRNRPGTTTSLLFLGENNSVFSDRP